MSRSKQVVAAFVCIAVAMRRVRWRRGGSIEAVPFLEGSQEQCVRDSKGLAIGAGGSGAYGRCNSRNCEVFHNGGDVVLQGLFGSV